jgi:hypothetical protein
MIIKKNFNGVNLMISAKYVYNHASRRQIRLILFNDGQKIEMSMLLTRQILGFELPEFNGDPKE